MACAKHETFLADSKTRAGFFLGDGDTRSSELLAVWLMQRQMWQLSIVSMLPSVPWHCTLVLVEGWTAAALVFHKHRVSHLPLGS